MNLFISRVYLFRELFLHLHCLFPNFKVGVLKCSHNLFFGGKLSTRTDCCYYSRYQVCPSLIQCAITASFLIVCSSDSHNFHAFFFLTIRIFLNKMATVWSSGVTKCSYFFPSSYSLEVFKSQFSIEPWSSKPVFQIQNKNYTSILFRDIFSQLFTCIFYSLLGLCALIMGKETRTDHARRIK